MKWKGKFPDSWIHELDFDAYDVIQEYWSSQALAPLPGSVVKAPVFEPPIVLPSPAVSEAEVSAVTTRSRRNPKPNFKYFV